MSLIVGMYSAQWYVFLHTANISITNFVDFIRRTTFEDVCTFFCSSWVLYHMARWLLVFHREKDCRASGMRIRSS